MPETTPQNPRLLTLDPACAPAPPGWAIALAPVAGAAPGDNGVRIQTSSGPSAHLVTVIARRARAADASELEAMSAAVYQRIRESLAERGGGALAPVRFWNHIPGIGEETGGGLDRYRVFNKGRKAALARWIGESAFERRLPAATGVGHEGDDLVVHCLACAAEGQPLENPRQRPAYRYSARYGPTSPSFARATRLTLGRGGRQTLLVGGTASVCGEDTAHIADLDAQFDETVENLRALLAAAQGAGGAADDRSCADEPACELERFTSVRIYYRRAEDESHVRARSLALFPRAQVIELMRADICRPELLVEIEGQAELTPAPAPGRSPAAAGAAHGG
jgi:chorismate lyase/3-hydroxybenzoate synthase